MSYMYQKKIVKNTPNGLIMANIPQEPYGHEMHIYRQDCDYFYFSLAIKYGAKVSQNTKVEYVNIDDSGVVLKLVTGEIIRSSYVVDACGYQSILSHKYNPRTYNLETHSRAIFAYAVDEPSFHNVA